VSPTDTFVTHLSTYDIRIDRHTFSMIALIG